MTAETGTYRWMAPEVIEHKPYDHRADVFCYAIVLWELLTGEDSPPHDLCNIIFRRWEKRGEKREEDRRVGSLKERLKWAKEVLMRALSFDDTEVCFKRLPREEVKDDLESVENKRR